MESKIKFLEEPLNLKKGENKTKALYCSESTHKKVAFLTILLKKNRTQITENIFNKFFDDYKDSIDDLIHSKRNEMRDFFESD